MSWGQLLAAGAGLASSLLENRSSRQNAAATNAASAENAGPWAPAVPYMRENLRTNADMRDYYRQNPFNAQQKTSYQNLFGDLDNFRQNTAPGLMGFANNAMGSRYDRQRGGEVGSGGGYGGPVRPGGLLQGGQGPFSVNPGQQYGLLDFGSLPAIGPMQDMQQGMPQGGQQGMQSGNFGRDGGRDNFGGDNWDAPSWYDDNLDQSNSVPTQIGSTALGLASAISPALGLALTAGNESGMFGNTYNGYGALDGTTSPATGPGTIGVRDYYGSNRDSGGRDWGGGNDYGGGRVDPRDRD